MKGSLERKQAFSGVVYSLERDERRRRCAAPREMARGCYWRVPTEHAAKVGFLYTWRMMIGLTRDHFDPIHLPTSMVPPT